MDRGIRGLPVFEGQVRQRRFALSTADGPQDLSRGESGGVATVYSGGEHECIASLKSLVISNPSLKPILSKVNKVRCQSWDRIHGVDTYRELPLVGMAFQSKNKTDGLEYQSHHPAVTRLGLTAIPIRHEDYTFIDIGCGKGRALLVASAFPLRKIMAWNFRHHWRRSPSEIYTAIAGPSEMPRNYRHHERYIGVVTSSIRELEGVALQGCIGWAVLNVRHQSGRLSSYPLS